MLIVLMLNPVVANKHFQVKSVVGGQLISVNFPPRGILCPAYMCKFEVDIRTTFPSYACDLSISRFMIVFMIVFCLMLYDR